MFSKQALHLQSLTMNITQSNNSSMLDNFNQALGNTGTNIPTVFATIGLALLGILIPLTIAILQDLLQKKAEQSDGYSILDLHVILDKVFRIKALIFFSGLVFVPLIFWDIQIGYVRLFEITLSTIGLLFILQIVLGVYNWTKGNISSYRKNYLEDLDKTNDMLTVWSSIWNNKNMTLNEEVEYFKIYSDQVDKAIKLYEN
jgi:hypothetical protein